MGAGSRPAGLGEAQFAEARARRARARSVPPPRACGGTRDGPASSREQLVPGQRPGGLEGAPDLGDRTARAATRGPCSARPGPPPPLPTPGAGSPGQAGWRRRDRTEAPWPAPRGARRAADPPARRAGSGAASAAGAPTPPSRAAPGRPALLVLARRTQGRVQCIVAAAAAGDDRRAGAETPRVGSRVGERAAAARRRRRARAPSSPLETSSAIAAIAAPRRRSTTSRERAPLGAGQTGHASSKLSKAAPKRVHHSPAGAEQPSPGQAVAGVAPAPVGSAASASAEPASPANG